MSNGKNDKDQSFDPPFDASDFNFDDNSSKSGEQDFDFGFDEPPSPDGSDAGKASFAQPVDDGGFDDDTSFGSETAAEDVVSDFGNPNEETGFAPDGDDFGGQGGDFLSSEYVADNSGDGADFVEDTGADFSEQPIEEEQEDVPLAAGDDRSFLQKNMFWLVAAGFGVFLLGVGYYTLSPLLNTTAPVQQNIPTMADSPTSMPTGPIAQADAPTPAFLEPQSPPPTLPGMDAPAGADPFVQEPTPLPPADAAPVPALPSPSLSAETSAPAAADPFTLSPASAPESSTVQDGSLVAALEGRVAGLEDQIATLVAELDALKANPPAAIEAPVPAPTVQPMDKPVVIDGWVLRGVSGEAAWIENAGNDEIIEISVGSEVAGAGRVTGIQMYEGDWLVVTQSGVILQN